jgi:hypothetical protein
MVSSPTSTLTQITIPTDGNDFRVEAELLAMVDRVLQDDLPTANDENFYLLYIPPGVNPFRFPEQLKAIPFSLEPKQLQIDMEREMRSIFILNGTEGVMNVSSSVEFTEERYQFELQFPGVTPSLLPKGGSQLDTSEKIREAGRRLFVAANDVRRAIIEESKLAVKKIEDSAIKIGKERLNILLSEILEEVGNYIDYTALSKTATPESFISEQSQNSRVFLRGPKIRDLVAALDEIKRDRLVLEEAARQVQAKVNEFVTDSISILNFEKALETLTNTVEIMGDEFPVLHRIWEKVSLPSDIGYDKRDGHLIGFGKEAIEATGKLKEKLFYSLKDAYEANTELSALFDLNTSAVWDLPPLIDLALEDLDEAGVTLPCRSAQERLQEQEKLSIASILASVTGILELGGFFLTAEPPILLSLAVASAVLGIVSNVQDFLVLRTKDKAYLASLDPQSSFSEEPSYFGFSLNIIFSLLDIKGVKDAMLASKAARYGGEIDDLLRSGGVVN